MVESNNEINSQPSYDWNKAIKTGQKDEIIATLREQFITNLINDYSLNDSIFTEKLDAFTPSFLESLKNKVTTYFAEYPPIKDNIFESIVSQSFAPLLERLVIKPYGKITLNTFQLFKIFESISKIESEIQIKCTPEQVNIVFMDPSRILLSIGFLSADTYSFYKEGKVSINAEDFSKLLNCTKKELCNSTLFFGKDQLFIQTESQKYQSNLLDRFNYIELDLEEAPTGNLESIDYPLKFQISPDQFQYILKKINEVSEIVEIEGYSDRLIFSGSGARAERTITFSKKDLSLIEYEPNNKNDRDYEASAHSLTFLKAINSYSQLLEKDGVITFSMKYDHPIKVVYEISLTQLESNDNHSSSSKVKESPIGSFKAITYLAPRALEEQNEEFDEDTEDEDEL